MNAGPMLPRPLFRRMAVAWAVGLALGTLAFQLAAYTARTLPRPSALEELSYYPSGRALAPATLGHANSAADLAWLRAVQYYGEHRGTDLRFTRMEHVFGIISDLAPGFESPYVFGAFALAQEGRDFAAAERLLQRGMELNPRSGRLAFETGFLYFVRPGGRDLARAAECFERASYLPGAPDGAGRFAAYCRQHAGDLGVALALWERVRVTSPNRFLREMAEREIEKIASALASGRRDLAVRRLTVPAVVLKSDP